MYSVVQMTGKQFCEKHPEYRIKYPEVCSFLTSDPKYVVRILKVNGQIQGVEFGYESDPTWTIPKPATA